MDDSDTLAAKPGSTVNDDLPSDNDDYCNIEITTPVWAPNINNIHQNIQEIHPINTNYSLEGIQNYHYRYQHKDVQHHWQQNCQKWLNQN